MNIVTRTYSSKYIVRPDTTWERDNEDFYPPEFVSALSFTPVMFARISKPGRSIGKQFADRYFDGINFGILLYPEDLLGPAEEDFACASCLDHTSFLTFPTINKAEFDWSADYLISKNGIPVFQCGPIDAEIIERAIEESTKYIYIRSGDILAIELQARVHLCSREDGNILICSAIKGHPQNEFNIIF